MRERLSLREAADRYNLSKTTIRRRMASGDLSGLLPLRRAGLGSAGRGRSGARRGSSHGGACASAGVSSGPQTPVLAAKLASLSHKGENVLGFSRGALRRGPLPDEHAAAALP